MFDRRRPQLATCGNFLPEGQRDKELKTSSPVEFFALVTIVIMSLYASILSVASRNLKVAFKAPVVTSVKSFHSGGVVRGFEEFKDQLNKDEAMKAGRAWTTADLRRKVLCCAAFCCHF